MNQKWQFSGADFARNNLTYKATAQDAVTYLQRAGAHNIRVQGTWQVPDESAIPAGDEALQVPYASAFALLAYDAPALVKPCPACGEGTCNGSATCHRCKLASMRSS